MSSGTRPSDGGVLSFMDKITPSVLVYRPKVFPPGQTANTDGQPRLIIVASWTDARDPHIAKYILKYQGLYPAAQILLLKSTTALIFKSSLIGPAMKPAVPVVRACFPAGSSSPSSPELLIHMFSNGGSSSVANLYDQYAATAGDGEDRVLPRHVTIFDSCPGVYHVRRTVAFFYTSLTSFQRLVFAPFIYLVAAGWSVMIGAGLLSDSLMRWGKAHNDRDRVLETRRTYIYSEADKLIDSGDIEDYADEARRKGFSVRMEKFDGSAHVAHARHDQARYWEVVRSTWEGN